MDAVGGPNTWKMLEAVKKLSGTQGGAARNEVLRHKGREIASPVAKADAFMQQYAAVSRLKIHDRTERMRRKVLQRKLAAESTAPESCQVFSPKELSEALSQMKAKSAAGPDEISPRFLKTLHGPERTYSPPRDSQLVLGSWFLPTSLEERGDHPTPEERETSSQHRFLPPSQPDIMCGKDY